MKRTKKPVEAIMRKQLRKIPEMVLADMLLRKATEAGAALGQRGAAAWAKRILNKNEARFRSRARGAPSNLTLNFSEAELASAEAKVKAVQKAVVAGSPELAERFASVYAKGLRRRWPEHDGAQREESADFRAELLERWGEPLALLGMLIAAADDISVEYASTLRRSRRDAMLRNVLLRLHARGIQVAREAVLLLESGYADGAMARWRTLHEIHVVAELLVMGGEALAERYLEHEAVAAKKSLNKYLVAQPALGLPLPSKRLILRTERDYQRVLKRFGDSFDEPNGWAADFLQRRRPSIADIEKKVQQEYMRSYYDFASHNVHAGVRGISTRLGVLPGTQMVLTGASNAGLAEPVRSLARTLTRLTDILLASKKGIDTQVARLALALLRDDAQTAASRAEANLWRDEQRLRRRGSLRPHAWRAKSRPRRA